MWESESHRALSPGTETQDITGQVKGKDSHPGAGELGVVPGNTGCPHG